MFLLVDRENKMPNKIHIPYYQIANVLYVTIRDATGNVWNTSSKTFGVWSDGSIANYVTNATFKGGSLYIAEFPLDISRGYYTIMIFLQGGVSPVVDDDIWLGTLSSYWDKDNANLLGVRVDSLVEYSGGERFSEKALETTETQGTGNIKSTYTVKDSDSNPIDGVDVWVTTDLVGSNVIASGVTNTQGQVDFYLNVGTYYVWSQKAGYDFDNPDTEVVD